MHRTGIKHILLGVALMGFAMNTEASTIIVDQGGGGAFTTIQAAVDAAVSSDTIQINAGTYNEGVQLPGDKDLVLEAAEGASVTINAPVDHALNIAAGNNHLVVRGDSSTNRLIVRGLQSTAVETQDRDGSLLVENVEFAGVINGFGSHFRTSVPSGSITFKNCLWSHTVGAFNHWTALCLAGPGQYVLNDCIFRNTGQMNALRSWVSAPGSIVARNTIFEGYDPSVGFDMSNEPVCVFSSDMGAASQTYIFENCRFNGYNWVYASNAGNFPNNTAAAKSIRLINPELGIIDERGSDDGSTRMVGVFQTACGEQVSIEGTSATAKCDLRNSSFFNQLLNMTSGGQLTLQDCVLRGGAWTNIAVELPGSSNFPTTVTIERCLFPGAGKFSTFNQSATVGTGGATIRVNNSIVQFKDELFNFSTHGSAIALQLNHTTVQGIAGEPQNAQAIGLESHDTLTAHYSIFDMGQSSLTRFANAGFTGAHDLSYISSGTGFSGTVPGDLIQANPQLLSDGRIGSDASPAIDAGTGSTELIDYNGAARTGAADLGALEYVRITAARSAAWTLLE